MGNICEWFGILPKKKGLKKRTKQWGKRSVLKMLHMFQGEDLGLTVICFINVYCK